MTEIGQDAGDRLKRRSVLAAWCSCIVFILSLLIFGFLSMRMGQDANWDLKNYHYYNAYALLHDRLGFDYAPAYMQTYHNPFLDVPFYFLIEGVRPRWVGFIIGALHGITFWVIFLVAQRVLGRSNRLHVILLSLACAAIGLYGPGAVSELGTTFHDLTLAPVILSSLLFLLREAVTINPASQDSPRTYVLVVSGLLLGAAVGLKYTMAVYAPGLALALLVLCHRSLHRLRVLLQWMTGLALGLVLTSGYWMYTLGRRFGNPLAPYYNGIFQSPYFDPVNFSMSFHFPKTLLQKLFYPFYFRTHWSTVSEVPFQDIRFALAYILVILVLLSWIYRATRRKGYAGRREPPSLPRTHWMLLLFFISSYIVWQVQFSTYRYLVPLEVLVPLIIFVLLTRLISKPYTRLLICSLLFMAIVGTMQPMNWSRVEWRDTFFGTTAPVIQDPSRTIVLMSSEKPTAYMIPAFPPQARFVRIEPMKLPTWPAYAGPETRLLQDIRSLIAGHDGFIYVLTDSSAIRTVDEYLQTYRLELDHDTCAEVTNYVTREILFCAVSRGKG